MKLQLSSNKVTSLNLIQSSEVGDFSDLEELGFMFEPVFLEESSNFFKVFFVLRLKIKSSHLLVIEYESEFELDSACDDVFVSSDFPYVNAPAIAFPYLRAFVSTFLLNAGYEPIMLPSMNFSAMHKKHRQE